MSLAYMQMYLLHLVTAIGNDRVNVAVDMTMFSRPENFAEEFSHRNNFCIGHGA